MMGEDISVFAAYALIGFLQSFDVLLLVFARLLAFFMLVPVLAGVSVPVVARLSLALSVGHMVFASELVGVVEVSQNLPSYIVLVIGEVMAGLIMGFMVYLAFAVIYFAGQIIDYQIGFMMASVFDPTTQIQVPVVGNLLFFALMALFVVSGGFASVVGASVLSFQLAPVGQVFVVGNTQLLLYCLGMFGTYFSLGVRFALPIAGALFIVSVMLGILVKAVPQMNVFVVGFPLQALLGVAAMWFITPAFATYYYILYEYAAEMLMTVIGGLTVES